MAIGIAVLLLLAWALWFAFGKVTVYEVSRAARVEVSSSSREVSSIRDGRLVATGLYIGRRVRAGEVLAQLDSEPQKLMLAEAEARLAAFPAHVEGLRKQLAAVDLAGSGARQARAGAIASAQARTRAAKASAEFDMELARRQRLDAQNGGAAAIDAARAEAEARRAAAARDATRHDEGRIVGEAVARNASIAGDAAQLSAALEGAKGELAAQQAQVAQLRYEVEARMIRAPADGVIGSIMSVRLGEAIRTGASLATIVPEGDLHIVAAFDPAKGLGRLSVGQPARLRLDGFAWTQYGDFQARVVRVAGESSGDALRVELTTARWANRGLPLRHGMTGQVEVAIEEVSPAILVLRAIGQMLA
ncbi:MAG: HlyD family efflux transporter periplasmic adaptor subunit [Sphingomonadales bacterium]|nr:HlyD family efflux transporter periplasmic adaptor subunit [Sphingomonadales bacterium]